ncbi:hypothetical protein TSAR_006783 [Trichomalopsis sarcophagae]|uniref:Uncharacterized protein n=1 Tax=Trichomalopsis sarcophagae TaxID=543379 RepID=A0A232FMB1_9HYME|nr:hypothetical protein TSAR_006783 [Trichomalopsis sarcophagae]
MSDDQHTEDRLLGHTSCKTCTKVTQPIFDNGNTIHVCRNCLLVSNLFPPGTVNLTLSSCSSSPLLQPQGVNSSPTRSSSPQPADTAILNKILEKLNKLDSIEKLQNTMKNEAEENSRLLWKRMSAIERFLEPLNEIPRLMNRVKVVETDVTVLRAEQVDIKEKLEQLLAKGAGPSANSSLASALDLETVQHLRDSNARIQAQPNRTTSLRLLTYAVLKPLDAQLIESDITSARPLIKRRAVREDDADSASTAVAVTEMRPTPIAVTVSRMLMRSLISAKIKIRKLHTKQLSADLLRDARVTLPLPDSFIKHQ